MCFYFFSFVVVVVVVCRCRRRRRRRRRRRHLRCPQPAARAQGAQDDTRRFRGPKDHETGFSRRSGGGEPVDAQTTFFLDFVSKQC